MSVIEIARVSCLAKHWHFFHPILRENLKAIKHVLVPHRSNDSKTWLPVFYRPANEKNIFVSDLGLDQPRLITVGDDGEFRAIYDLEESLAIMADTDRYVKAPNSLAFESSDWIVPVFECFEFLPQALVIDRNRKCAFYPKLPSEKILEDMVLESDEVALCHAYPVYKAAVKQSQFTQPKLDNDYGWSKESWREHQGGYRLVPGGGTLNHKNTCAYDSTSDFLEHMFGVKLHISDRSWYLADDRVVADGLPMELTIEVLNELVEPYGFEIDRVWVADGNWKEEFSNFAAMVGLDGPVYQMARQIDPTLPEPRMFIGPVPNGIPMVVMAKSPTAAIPGGHATYIGPRSTRSDDILMGLTYKRK